MEIEKAGGKVKAFLKGNGILLLICILLVAQLVYTIEMQGELEYISNQVAYIDVSIENIDLMTENNENMINEIRLVVDEIKHKVNDL